MSEQVEPPYDPVDHAGVEERDYLLDRAAAHRASAATTQEAGAKSVHMRLAQLYDERAARIDLVDRDQQAPQNH